MHTGSQYFDSILPLWLFTQFLFVTCRSLIVFVGMCTNLFLPPYYQKVQNCALGTTALGIVHRYLCRCHLVVVFSLHRSTMAEAGPVPAVAGVLVPVERHHSVLGEVQFDFGAKTAHDAEEALLLTRSDTFKVQTPRPDRDIWKKPPPDFR